MIDISEKNAFRLNVLLYKLCDGKENVPIDEDVLVKEALKCKLFEMSDEEFEIFSCMVQENVNLKRKKESRNIN